MSGLYISSTPTRGPSAFPGQTLERLRRLKALYDPDNLFDQDFSVARAAVG